MAVVLIEPLERRQLLSANPTFTPATNVDLQTKTTPDATIVADVNGDGIPDIVTLGYNGQVGVSIGNGNGTFQTTQSVYDGVGSSGGGDQSLAVVSLASGKKAIIASSYDYSTVSVITSNAAGVWSVYGTYANQSNGSDINALTVSDINGTAFLVTANSSGSITYSQIEANSSGEGFFGAEHTINAVITSGVNGATTSALVSIASGNFISGGNGADLVVVGSNHSVAVLKGKNSGGLSSSGGGFTAPTKTALDTNTQSGVTTAAAVYGSGTSNVLVKTTTNTIIPLVGGGSTVTSPFSVASTINPELGNGSVAVGDFNGDGSEDFAYVSKGGSTWSLYLSNSGGSGGYNSGGTFTKSSDANVYSTAAGDFKGDGEASLATSYYASSGSDAFVGVSQNSTPLAPAFTSASSATVTVGSVFSFTVTSDGVPSPKITETGGLPPGLNFKDNGDGTATISGKATTTDKTSYVLHLTSKNATDTATQTLTLHISEQASFTSPNSDTLGEGVTATFVVKTTHGFVGGSVAPLSATLDGNDLSGGFDGLTFVDNGDGTGTLSGTPTISGNHTMIVTDGSGALAIDQSVALKILAKPTFDGGSSAAFTVGTFDTTAPSDLDEEITASGFPNANISISSGSLPKGLKFKDNGDGTADISGTPAKGTGGEYTLKLVAGNSAGSATNQPFTYTVDVAETPVIVSAASTTFTVGKAGTKFVVKATGNSGSGVPSFSSDVDVTDGIVGGSLPTGLTFHDNGDGTATISGTPAAGTGGVYTLTLATATDKNDSSLPSTATQTFTLTVDESPAFASATDSSTVIAGSAITPIVVSTTAGFPSSKMTESGSFPKGLTFTDNGNGTATISGTPAATSGGVYKFNIKATNSGGTATQKYTLQVDQLVKFAGNVTTKTVNATHGHATHQTIGLTGFDTPFSTLTNTGGGLTQNGLTIALNTGGTALLLTGTPVAAQTTTFTFTIDEHDGDASSTLTLHVVVA